ncbi:Sir2 silent information regulator family NAD-dependent deacetylase [Adlercreutzia sp. ZJ473]|uniref:SIR2 family NAD-dependent protein deacylase n=1 Tax=Adlercreutzia sp. ZJ473 TaxID=2722822 RepID=UPI0015525EB2|nr:Sir2 silent information regulator family NAD-dependent deacetylase [Adlercreutzia sp. ZJ473]
MSMPIEKGIKRLAHALKQCNSVIIGAGSGLSTAAGLTYSGERFERYFGDLIAKYGLADMYSAGFYQHPTPEDFWGYWCRHIWVNRYMSMPKDTYGLLLQLAGPKDHFVLTTNVDHCFQKAGFDKEMLFYTQGDYGLFQCSRPCCQKTWDNYDQVRAMVESEGFAIENDGTLVLPDAEDLKTAIPSDLIPTCPECGAPATTNLRVDGSFVEDEGWHTANDRYREYLGAHAEPGNNILFLELGVGFNTPVIIKYPFWQMTARNADAVYACVNMGDVMVPAQIEDRSICIDGDINEVLASLVASQEEGAIR